MNYNLHKVETKPTEFSVGDVYFVTSTKEVLLGTDEGLIDFKNDAFKIIENEAALPEEAKKGQIACTADTLNQFQFDGEKWNAVEFSNTKIFNSKEDFDAATDIKDGTFATIKNADDTAYFRKDGKWKVIGKVQDVGTGVKLENGVLSEDNDYRPRIEAIEAALNTPSASEEDIPIWPMNPGGLVSYSRQGTSVTSFADGQTGGYVMFGGAERLRYRMFNRLKFTILIPGWLRIGIVRGTAANDPRGDGTVRGWYKAGAKLTDTAVYPKSLVGGVDGDTTADGNSHTMLKKWLVCQYVTTPGLKTFDIPDEVITSPFEYIYVECRTGVSGMVINKGTSAVTVSGLSYPASTAPTGVSIPTGFVTTTDFQNGKYAISNNMLDASCIPAYDESPNGASTGFEGIYSSSTSNIPYKIYNQQSNNLNLGIYQRGSKSSVVFNPLVENVIDNGSTAYDASSKKTGNSFYFYPNEDKLEGKSIYALDLFVYQGGELSVYVLTSKDPAKCKVRTMQTLRIRGIGQQRVHLNEEIFLQKGEILAIGGFTEAAYMYTGDPSSLSAITGYYDTVRWAYQGSNWSVSNFTAKGDDATGVQNPLTPYDAIIGDSIPRVFYAFNGVKMLGNSKGFDFTGASIVTNNNCNLNIGIVTRNGKKSKIEDWNVSITGDSISTYGGIINATSDWGVTNNAAGNNAICYPNSGSGVINGMDCTWWGSFIKQNRARFLRNDAWSGSTVTGSDSSTSSSAAASNIRCQLLRCSTPSSNPRTSSSGLGHPYGEPDLIVCMIGTNDLAGSKSLGAYQNTYSTMTTIIGAFQQMIAYHRQKYAGCKFIYFLIPRGSQAYPWPYVNPNSLSISQLSDSLEYAAKMMGVYFVPINKFDKIGINSSCWMPSSGYFGPRSGQYVSNLTTDYLHPSAIGMEIIADVLTKFVEENF